MMRHPIVNTMPDLDDCQSDAERARWLLTASIASLSRDYSFIRLILRRARFQIGLSYLDAEIAHLSERRCANGSPATTGKITDARSEMERIASGISPLNMGT